MFDSCQTRPDLCPHLSGANSSPAPAQGLPVGNTWAASESANESTVFASRTAVAVQIERADVASTALRIEKPHHRNF